MRRFFAWFLLLVSLGTLVGQGHVVSQFYGEKKDAGLELIFDVGYALPVGRDDPSRPPLMREWLESQTEKSHAALRRDAEVYLRECMKFVSGETELEMVLAFTDFQASAVDFLRMLNGVAYYRVMVKPVALGRAAKLIWCAGKRPDLVVRTGDDAYVTLKPGEEMEWSAAAAMSEGEVVVAGESAWRVAFVQGVLHVLPKGLDHMLFLAAMFLAVGMGKNLWLQSLSFTAAHTVTLGLCAAGVIVASPRWVEPLIALSIALLAMENVLRKQPAARLRLGVIFAFGLVHGCGFAQVLSLWITGSGNFSLSLLCANTGVEVAQVCVLVILWLVARPMQAWRCFKKIRLVANVGLILVGLMWTWERLVANG